MLEREKAAFEVMRPQLEADNSGKWVVFHEDEFVGVFESFDGAAQTAVARFGRGPYLIRQVGSGDLVLPASVMYRFA